MCWPFWEAHQQVEEGVWSKHLPQTPSGQGQRYDEVRVWEILIHVALLDIPDYLIHGAFDILQHSQESSYIYNAPQEASEMCPSSTWHIQSCNTPERTGKGWLQLSTMADEADSSGTTWIDYNYDTCIL